MWPVLAKWVTMSKFSKISYFIFTFSIKRLSKWYMICWNRMKIFWATPVWSRQSQQSQLKFSEGSKAKSQSNVALFSPLPFLILITILIITIYSSHFFILSLLLKIRTDAKTTTVSNKKETNRPSALLLHFTSKQKHSSKKTNNQM